MDEAFAARQHDEWVRETRARRSQDTKWDIQARSYYLDRRQVRRRRERGLGARRLGRRQDRLLPGPLRVRRHGYTSQKLSGDEDKDGTLLLKPGQEGYTVLGEIYGEALLWEGARVTAGRKGFDTPYINRNDVRMTPNTFTAAVLQGLVGGGDQPEWRYGFGYFDEIKERNSDDFDSMSDDAGAPGNVDRGVWAGGVNYKTGRSRSARSITGATTSSTSSTPRRSTPTRSTTTPSSNFAASTPTSRASATSCSPAATSPRPVGREGRARLQGALFTVAYTSTGNGDSMKNPWSGYPATPACR
jgi:hypothetical protein